MAMKKKHAESEKRITEVRRQLIDREFHCLSNARFGLPIYSNVEAWIHQATGTVVYLLYDLETGSWDVLASLDYTNNTESTWAGVDALVAKARGRDEHAASVQR